MLKRGRVRRWKIDSEAERLNYSRPALAPPPTPCFGENTSRVLFCDNYHSHCQSTGGLIEYGTAMVWGLCFVPSTLKFGMFCLNVFKKNAYIFSRRIFKLNLLPLLAKFSFLTFYTTFLKFTPCLAVEIHS